MPAAFLQLQRNAEFWRTRCFPKAPQPERKPCTGAAGLGGARVTFEGDPVVFQWYPGQGLQIQPLANFGKANALWRACQPPARAAAARRRRRRPPCRPEELRALLDRMVALASRARRLHRVGVLLRVRRRHAAVDQRPRAGHGDPGADARLAAAGRPEVRRGRPPRARRVRAHAAARRPRAVHLPGRGRHYLIYSFATGLRVLNGFLQSLVGLHDFADATGDRRARRLFRDGDRAARREIPRYDTGAWSLYSLGGNESDLGYHRLVRDFLSLAVRAHQGGRLLRARQALRPLPARAHAGRLRRRRRGRAWAPRRTSASRSPSSRA